MQCKSVLVFFLCFFYLSIHAQNNKIPENTLPKLEHTQSFEWKPSDRTYGIDATIEFSLSYYVVDNKYSEGTSVLVAQNVKIDKGNTIYHTGKTFTRQDVDEKAFNNIRVQEVDFKVTLTDGTRNVDVFFTDMLPQEEDHVRKFGWVDVFYGDYHPDRKPLDVDTTEKYDALSSINKKMIHSNAFKVSNVEFLDAKCYNIPRPR